MERICASYAMEWSIDLEKALRSKRPGEAAKAIQETGARLQQWSRELNPIIAAYNIYGLAMGEDRLFANTILLRLADAFRLGDEETRVSVVRAFLKEFRSRDKYSKGRRYKGLLSKARVHNHTELLKRVKVVFDAGDVESRALALVLFGCWADFAKDSAHTRYLIFSSLVSSETLEVKASLFAASCFCELAADFAAVMLEMLLKITLSPDTLLTIRVASAHVFAKMRPSYSVASRAYKIGVKLLIDSSEEDFLVAMLISLSKLSAGSAFLSEHVNLLSSFISSGRTLRVQATALRCIHFILSEGVCPSPVNSHVIKIILGVIDAEELPLAMQCEALQILRMVIVYGPPGPICDKLGFTQLLNIIEKAANSFIMAKSLLAINVLVDVSTKIKKSNQMGSDEDCSRSLPTQVISVIMDQIIFLVKPLLDICQNNSKALQDFQSLFNLLLCLTGEIPGIADFVLDKVKSFVQFLVDKLNSVMATSKAGVSVDKLADSREQNFCSSILVLNIHKFSASCLENLNEAGIITAKIIDELQLMVKYVQHCKFFDEYIHLIFSVFLHSHIIWGRVLDNSEASCSVSGNLGNSLCNYLVTHEIVSLEHAKNMMTRLEYWPAYRAGMFAAYQGAWATAAFIFGQLIGKAQSDSCSCWLQGLSLVAHSEVKIQLFLLPNLRSSLVDWLQMKDVCFTVFADNLDEIAQGSAGNVNGSHYAKVLVAAYHGLHSSGKMLKSISMLGKPCYFQRWFLAVRAKVLRTVVDMLEVLSTTSLMKGSITNSVHDEESVTVECLNSLRQISQISFELKNLAEEFDLISMSFIGMDSRSLRVISSLAFGCSLLAFAAGFVLFVSDLIDHKTLTCVLQYPKNCLRGPLIQNLVGHLWFIDQEVCSKLFLLSEFKGQAKKCFHLKPGNPMMKSCGKSEIFNVCESAICGMFDLRDAVKGKANEEILWHITLCGFQLVFTIMRKWMNFPFQIPKFFFKLRPCIGSELFAFSADTRNPNELTLLPGFYLSLNLCLQVRNAPPDLGVQRTKLYCILCCNASFQEHKSTGRNSGETFLDYESWDMSTMMTMNKKLFSYVTECVEKTGNGKRGRDCDNDSDDGNVYVFVCFEVNDWGQGFSSCLLDVSNFPVGCYRIKWHSCLIDDRGSYWSLLPLNSEPVFSVHKFPTDG